MARPDAIEAQADRAMRWIDSTIGPVESKWSNERAIKILGALLERVEWAIAEAKQRDF
jgi:hypothetical protein